MIVIKREGSQSTPRLMDSKRRFVENDAANEGKKEKKKKKRKKNVLSLSTGQGRDEVCRALHRTDARAFHKNTLEYSYQTIISRFRSPTLYILLACYIVYPDFFFPLLLVFRIRVRSLLFLVSATAIDAVGQSVQTLRFDHLPLRSLHPIQSFLPRGYPSSILLFDRLRRGKWKKKKKVSAKVKIFYRGETTISIRFHFALIFEGMLVVFTLRHFRCLF